MARGAERAGVVVGRGEFAQLYATEDGVKRSQNEFIHFELIC
jgi:hypothetical protein